MESSWRLLEESPLPVKDYSATIRVRSEGDGNVVKWEGTFEPSGVDERFSAMHCPRDKACSGRAGVSLPPGRIRSRRAFSTFGLLVPRAVVSPVRTSMR